MAQTTAADLFSVSIRVNGELWEDQIGAGETLLDLVREKIGLTGPKRSCEAQVCGACTVLVDGLPVSACCYLAFQADGKSVTTVEGIAEEGRPSDLQQHFVDLVASQCGFCTPGQVVTATALLDTIAAPSRDEITDWMKGNLCRCGCYPAILRAIVETARARVSE